MKLRNTLMAAPLAILLATAQQCSDKVAAIVKAVQDKATAVCGFVPTAESVIAVLNAQGVKTSTASDIALATNIICVAVRPTPANNRMALLAVPLKVPVATTIKGQRVIIDGRFVR